MCLYGKWYYMEKKAVNDCELFYKKASKINDQTTESSLIVITITCIYRNVTKLIEIAIKYTKLTLILGSFDFFFNSLLSVATVTCYHLNVLSTCLSWENFVSDTFKKLGHKNAIKGPNWLKEKKYIKCWCCICMFLLLKILLWACFQN